MAVRSWKEGVDIQSVAVFGEDSGGGAAKVWGVALTSIWCVGLEIDGAREDISRLTALDESRPTIYLDPTEDGARMKVYSTRPITLTTLMPILGELGVRVTDEYPFRISPRNGHTYYLYDV